MGRQTHTRQCSQAEKGHDDHEAHQGIDCQEEERAQSLLDTFVAGQEYQNFVSGHFLALFSSSALCSSQTTGILMLQLSDISDKLLHSRAKQVAEA